MADPIILNKFDQEMKDHWSVFLNLIIMKKFNFFAIVASVFLQAACGSEQTQENGSYEAPETTQESPSDVYNEGEVIEEEATEDPAVDINADGEGADLGVDTDEVDVNIDTREAEEVEASDDTVVVE